MAEALVAAQVVGAVMQARSTIASGNLAAAQGAAAQTAQNYKAKQMEQRAGQERAASQRNALEARRKGRFTSSRALALAAASGGGAADPTIVNIMGGLDEDSEYRALMELYGGEEKARGLEQGGNLARYEGKMAYAAGKARQKASRTAAFGQLVSGVGKAGYSAYQGGMFEKFNPDATISGGTVGYAGGGYGGYGSPF